MSLATERPFDLWYPSCELHSCYGAATFEGPVFGEQVDKAVFASLALQQLLTLYPLCATLPRARRIRPAGR